MALSAPLPHPIELINVSAQLEYQADKFAQKLLLDREHQKTTLFAFTKGQALKTHSTPQAALLVMLEGVCNFKINNTTQLLIAGEVIVIPANVPHSLTAATDFKMILIK